MVLHVSVDPGNQAGVAEDHPLSEIDEDHAADEADKISNGKHPKALPFQLPPRIA